MFIVANFACDISALRVLIVTYCNRSISQFHKNEITNRYDFNKVISIQAVKYSVPLFGEVTK